MQLIYIVEDDKDIRDIESISLLNSNYEVSAFARGRDFFAAMEEKLPDLVLLDVMLPDQSGYDIVQRMRKEPAFREIPVIMVTAKTSDMDLVKGINEGADDYIKKPFSVMELISRVKARLRRSEAKTQTVFEVQGISMDDERHQVCVNGEEIKLTYKEYELLHLFMNHIGIVLSREVIMQKVWETDFEGESRTVDVHIKTLRQKLKDAGRVIRTIRNVGYMMEKE